MDTFTTALETSVTSAALWGALTPLTGLITVALLFSVAVYFLRRGVSGLGRGKAKI